jgi:hypothetical protein
MLKHLDPWIHVLDSHNEFREVVLEVNGRIVASTVVRAVGQAAVLRDPDAQLREHDAVRAYLLDEMRRRC